MAGEVWFLKSIKVKTTRHKIKNKIILKKLEVKKTSELLDKQRWHWLILRMENNRIW